MASEKQLFKAIRDALIAGFAPLALDGLQIKQAWQPTQQGAPSGATIYLTLVTARRIGSPLRTDVYDVPNQKMIHTETQRYTSTFQVNALSIQNPAEPDQLTAGDIVNYAAYVMQSDTTIAALRALDIGIERITEVRNPQFQDDKDRFEASPSWDITLTHKQIVVTEVPVLQLTEFQILTV